MSTQHQPTYLHFTSKITKKNYHRNARCCL